MTAQVSVLACVLRSVQSRVCRHALVGALMRVVRHVLERALERVLGLARGVVPAGALAHVPLRAETIAAGLALVGVIRDVTQRARGRVN